MTPACERLQVEADADHGVTSRLLDLLSAADRFPRAMRLDREGEVLRFQLDLDPVPGSPLVGRIGQIAGVRRVVATVGAAS